LAASNQIVVDTLELHGVGASWGQSRFCGASATEALGTLSGDKSLQQVAAGRGIFPEPVRLKCGQILREILVDKVISKKT
jgi:hypothetical protein